MQFQPQITFRGLDASPAITALIEEKVAKLEQFHHNMTSCRVEVKLPHRKGHKGNHYEVTLEIEVPGGSVIVNKNPGDMHAHEDLHVTLRDSFDAARRQLDEHMRKIGGVDVKSHPERHYGTVVRLFAEEGYGFARMAGGREVYFQKDSVTGSDWGAIAIDSELVFSLMDGESGLFGVNVSLRG